MSTIRIPNKVRAEALGIMEKFNQKRLAKTGYRYVPRFRGKYLYLNREDFGSVGPICRLEYLGGKKGWYFAIYKCSTEKYDEEDWFFPGNKCVDGTVEGALEAGMQAYQ
jgi:hypothetical protein